MYYVCFMQNGFFKQRYVDKKGSVLIVWRCQQQYLIWTLSNIYLESTKILKH